MEKKVLQSLLPLLVLATMVAGCGKNEAAIEPTEIVSEATEVTATEETEVTETEDTETEATEETETQETETQEPTEEAETDVSTEEKQTDASKETNNTTKETASASDSTTAAPQTETAPPVENNSQPAEQTQIVTSSATEIVQGSTGTTFLGTTYPIVSEFNKLGLNINYDNFFSSDGMSSEFAVAMGQANRSLSNALGYPSDFTAISATNTYLSYLDAHISRKPESGYYVFVYAGDITDSTDGGTSSRAAHQVMLGAITSTPAEVEAALFESTFTAPNGQEPISTNWTTIGDCQIIFAYADESKCEYLIKPAN
ncbi:MAG: hypothetical protein ACI4S2_06035 [Lachnospiraceae bacterium]